MNGPVDDVIYRGAKQPPNPPARATAIAAPPTEEPRELVFEADLLEAIGIALSYLPVDPGDLHEGCLGAVHQHDGAQRILASLELRGWCVVQAEATRVASSLTLAALRDAAAVESAVAVLKRRTRKPKGLVLGALCRGLTDFARDLRAGRC